MGRLPKPAALIGALAAAAPTAAGAAVTQNVTGDTLTVTSDQAADTTTLGAAGGVITVNCQATTRAADNHAEIVVDAVFHPKGRGFWLLPSIQAWISALSSQTERSRRTGAFDRQLGPLPLIVRTRAAPKFSVRGRPAVG